MEPALVPERPSISTRPSSRNLSITPQPNAPWAPPPCSAKLMRFFLEVSTDALDFIAIIEPFELIERLSRYQNRNGLAPERARPRVNQTTNSTVAVLISEPSSRPRP